MRIARSTSAVEKPCTFAPLVRVARVEQRHDVEIAVADMADDRREQPVASRSAWVSPTQSASAEIGTQTSVVKTSAPGRRPRTAQ